MDSSNPFWAPRTTQKNSFSSIVFLLFQKFIPGLRGFEFRSVPNLFEMAKFRQMSPISLSAISSIVCELLLTKSLIKSLLVSEACPKQILSFKLKSLF